MSRSGQKIENLVKFARPTTQGEVGQVRLENVAPETVLRQFVQCDRYQQSQWPQDVLGRQG